MIIGIIKEGLGNQLFQYFFIRNIAKNHEYFFDISFYNQNFKRNFDLLNFQGMKINFLNQKIKDPILITDDFSGEIPEIDPEKNYIFNGYWQNKKFLNKNLIHKEATFSDSLLSYINKNFRFLFEEECVSMHVRRGDFLNLQKNYQKLEKNYYDNAINYFDKNIKIVIYSDDIEWCKSNFTYPNVHYMNSSSIIDLCGMSLCKHNIIANSTFSFWGGYLNKNNGTVICPKKWFTESFSLEISNQKNPDCANNFLMEDWIRI
jgi:hypothetical protein